MGFAKQVGTWASDSKRSMQRRHKAIILELFSSVILDTPVLTGRLRANWRVSSNNPASGTVEISDPDGKVTISKVSDIVSKIDGNRDFNLFLANNLPYAYRIEYDGWSSVKAPEGMVRKNFIRISENLKAV